MIQKLFLPQGFPVLNSNVDLYLRLLIEADEELAKDPTIDQMSLSYNIQLNNRIAERLESLDRDKNK